MAKVKFEEMVNHIESHHNQKITNVFSDSVYFETRISKRVSARVLYAQKGEINIFYDDKLVAIICNNNNAHKAIKKFMKFIKECSEG